MDAKLKAIHADPQTPPTYAASYYLRTGAVQVSRRHRHMIDTMMRRTNAVFRAGLIGLPREQVEARSISEAEHSALGHTTAVPEKRRRLASPKVMSP